MSKHETDLFSETAPASIRSGQLPGRRESLAAALLLVVDLALASVIFVAPLLMGGRHPVGRLVFVALACVAAVAWAARQCFAGEGRWTGSGAELLFLGGVLLAVAQLVPLPQGWLARISPTIGDILPLWAADAETPAGLGRWSELSLTPEATRAGLVLFIGYGLLFVVTVQRLRNLRDVERMLRWIGVAAVLMAVFGLVQYFAGNGKFCWVYDHPFRDTTDAVKGSFINQNHFAHFLVLGIGPLVWWMQRLLAPREASSTGGFSTASTGGLLSQYGAVAVAGGLIVVAFAVLSSYSRGGVAVLFLAVVVCVGGYAWLRRLGRKAIAALGLVAAVVVAAVLIHGYTPLAKRMDTIRTSKSMDELTDGRQELWTAVGQAIPKFAVAGSGIGSHREVYPIYFSHYSYPYVEYTHAENGYAQVLLETGIPGFLLLLWGVGMCGYWCVGAFWNAGTGRKPSDRAQLDVAACTVAVFAALAASAVHSLVDFVWYIPACMSLTVLLAACACRLHRFSIAGRPDAPMPLLLPRPAWMAATAVLLIVSVAIIRDRLPEALASPHWDRYLALSLARSRNPGDRAAAESSVAAMMAHLEKALQANPDDPRANVRMAGLCIDRFEATQMKSANAMPLSQIRDAALASNFPTREAQDRWLSAAVGANRRYLDRALYHARRGLAGCPLQGEGYLCLAQLSFLEGTGGQAKAAYVAQALKVRPYHDAVLFFAGREAACVGNVSKALEFWKKAFHKGPQFRKPIVEMLAPEMPPLIFLRTFEPGEDGLRLLYDYYRDNDRAESARLVGLVYAKELERAARAAPKEEAGRQWQTACFVYQQIGVDSRSLDCARKAVASAPNEIKLRRTLAMCLAKYGQYDEAIDQFDWCLYRNPNDRALLEAKESAVKKKMDADRTSIGSAPRWLDQGVR